MTYVLSIWMTGNDDMCAFDENAVFRVDDKFSTFRAVEEAISKLKDESSITFWKRGISFLLPVYNITNSERYSVFYSI